MAKRSVIKARRKNEVRKRSLEGLPKIAPGTKFHIRDNGNVEPCRIIIDECLLGTDTVHYDSYKEAKVVADDMIAKNPEITEVPEAPMEGLFYQELVDYFGETKGWFSTYNGDFVSETDMEELLERKITYKEFISQWEVGLELGDYVLSINMPDEVETVTDRFGLAMDSEVVFDKNTKIEYRLSTSSHTDDLGKEVVDYISIDAYKNGKFSLEDSSYLPAGAFIDRTSKPWSIKDNE